MFRRRPDAAVVFFYVNQNPECYSAFREFSDWHHLKRYGWSTAAYTGNSDDNYKKRLNGFWDDPKTDGDLVTIEQDIEITKKVLPSFRKCKQDWCTFSYQGPPECGYLYRSLGCAKFSRKLRDAVPFERFYAHGGNVEFGSDHWQNVDVNIIRVLCDDLRLVPHVHGHVKHHHAYPVSRDSHPVNCLLYDTKDHVILVAKELQLDRSVKVYKVNPDGSRGDYLYDVPPMPKFSS